jgi:two-component system sensor histidine kinase KdpD
VPASPPPIETRPSPDALLATLGATGRGRLKVFLGAAPGVGKTYAMLEAGQARRRDGVDVVVGVVETHRRRETAALLDGLEVLPRREVEHRGQRLAEMDIEGLLARKPALALVDELAHTNAPGSRHPKRHQDVEDLLAAGIDVYTTVNVQHLESLNDVVAQITRVRVSETVPDSVLERADEVELVDLTPEDLLRRLKEGKVYMPDQAERALRHFFSVGNLTALRELALRHTAERVDDQMVQYMNAHAIAGPWPAGERVLVCVGPGPSGERLLRAGKRLADRLKARWYAVHVEAGAKRDGSRADETLRLAERMGGEVVTVTGHDAAEALMAFAAANNVTKIVVGASRRSRLEEFVRGSLVGSILRRARTLDVYVIADQESRTGKSPLGLAAWRWTPPKPAPYVLGSSIVAVTIGAAEVAQQLGAAGSLPLVFISGVLAAALVGGRGAGLFAALLSATAYNFLFLPPLYTFTIADPQNVLTLSTFVLVALVFGQLTARLGDLADAARRREATATALYAFARKLAGVTTLDDLLWAVAYQSASMLKARVILLLPQGERLEVQAGYPPDDQLTEAELAAAQWSWRKGSAAGRGAENLPGAERLFLPLKTAAGTVGVMGIERDAPNEHLAPSERRLVDALADQAAVAIERVRLAEEIVEARLEAESERLRTMLLRSISHDLRTPLASIVGAATGLVTEPERLTQADRADFAHTILEEAERLNRFIGNLLDMTRLEAGTLEVKRDWVDLGDVVGSALRRLTQLIRDREVHVRVDPALPLLRLDFLLTEQALVNLVDNALKYGAGAAIDIDVTAASGAARIDVRDRGSGVAKDLRDAIFDKFYRVHGGDRGPAGTGLGLSICRGFVTAQGGTVRALDPEDGGPGIVFRIEFPLDPDGMPP